MPNPNHIPDHSNTNRLPIYLRIANAHIVNSNDRLVARMDRRADYRRTRKKFEQKLGYKPDFELPTTLNEKIQWRKFNVKNDDYIRIGDKAEVQVFLAELLGRERVKNMFPRLYCLTDDYRRIRLPDAGIGFAVKPTHGSGMYHLVKADEPPNAREIINDCRVWLHKDYGARYHEYHYNKMPKRIIVEELLVKQDGSLANDVKLYMFGDRCGYVFIRSRTNEGVEEAIRFDFTGNNPQKLFDGWDLVSEELWREMLNLSREIGSYFDHVRVDFLATETRFVVGELTLTSGAGLIDFREYDVPPNFDLEVGKLWDQTSDGLIRSD